MTNRLTSRNPRGFWPNGAHLTVLRAILGDAEHAPEIFCEWVDSLDLNEHDVFDTATYRLIPALYQRMHALGVTHPAMARFKGIYRRAWSENHRLFYATAPIIAEMEANGIKTMLLKGAPLLIDYYKNYAVRPMSDIDVAIHAEHFNEATLILNRHGWHRVETAQDDDLKYRHSMLFRDQNGLELDLHWHFMFEAGNTDADEAFWKSAVNLDFTGVSTLQPSAALSLLLIVVHGLRFNAMPPIRWVPDALAIIDKARDEIDWSSLLDFAIRNRVSYRLGLGLGYLLDNWNAPIPQYVIDELYNRPRTIVERLENPIVLYGTERYDGNQITRHWVYFVDYCRVVTGVNALGFLVGFSHYVRYRWRVGSRSDILHDTLAGVVRRIRKLSL